MSHHSLWVTEGKACQNEGWIVSSATLQQDGAGFEPDLTCWGFDSLFLCLYWVRSGVFWFLS